MEKKNTTISKIEKPRKYCGDIHIKNIITQEECQKELSVITGIKYWKVALEEGEGKGLHLQYYFETENPTTWNAIRKKLHKVPFCNNCDIQIAKSPDKADDYIGNLDFVHSDGRKKGGKVHWVYKLGERYETNKMAIKYAQKKKYRDKTEEIRKHIKDGKDMFYIWENYFEIMLYAHRAIEKYFEIYHEQRTLSINAKLDMVKEISDINFLWRELHKMEDELLRLKAEQYMEKQEKPCEQDTLRNDYLAL